MNLKLRKIRILLKRILNFARINFRDFGKNSRNSRKLIPYDFVDNQSVDLLFIALLPFLRFFYWRKFREHENLLIFLFLSSTSFWRYFNLEKLPPAQQNFFEKLSRNRKVAKKFHEKKFCEWRNYLKSFGRSFRKQKGIFCKHIKKLIKCRMESKNKIWP